MLYTWEKSTVGKEILNLTECAFLKKSNQENGNNVTLLFKLKFEKYANLRKLLDSMVMIETEKPVANSASIIKSKVCQVLTVFGVFFFFF